MALSTCLPQLLVILGLRLCQSQTTPVKNECQMTLEACHTTYAGTAGDTNPVVCDSWNVFQKCFYANIYKCSAAEAAGWNLVYDKSLVQLEGCDVSTTPRDFSASSSEPGGSSTALFGGSYPSSGSTIPGSGTSGGRASGSSGLYMNWWQWLILLSCCCCCCLAGIVPVAMSRRRQRGPYGGYGGSYADPYGGGGYGGGGACDDYDDPYVYPAQYAPDQGFPLVGGGYPGTSAMMPTQFNMVQPAYY